MTRSSDEALRATAGSVVEVWTSAKSQSQKLRERAQELADAQTTTILCGLCDPKDPGRFEFVGRVREGRALFDAHRAEAHPDAPPVAPRRGRRRY